MGYLLVAYKSDGNDYRCGCVVDSWGSEHVIANHLTADQLRDKIVDILFDDRNGRGEFEFTIFKDGITVYENGSATFGHDFDVPPNLVDKMDEAGAAAMSEMDAIMNCAISENQRKIAAERAIEEDKKLKQAVAAEVENKKRRLEEFKRLQQEFGS